MGEVRVVQLLSSFFDDTRDYVGTHDTSLTHSRRPAAMADDLIKISSLPQLYLVVLLALASFCCFALHNGVVLCCVITIPTNISTVRIYLRTFRVGSKK